MHEPQLTPQASTPTSESCIPRAVGTRSPPLTLPNCPHLGPGSSGVKNSNPIYPLRLFHPEVTLHVTLLCPFWDTQTWREKSVPPRRDLKPQSGHGAGAISG